MMENILKVKNIFYDINGKEILKDISFECKKGEVVGIIGANGSGKTTLLKTLNGIFKIKSGEILINNKNIKDYEEKYLSQKIAFMNQNTNLGFDFPCIDIVVLGRFPYLTRFQKYSDEDFKKAEKYMKITNTLEFKNKSILEISGGERQRVLFAKVLTQETDITLLDEPSSSMDMMFENELFKYVENMKKENKLVIAVIHNLRVAIKYCTKLILLSDGKIIKEGSPHEVITTENLKKAYGVEAQIYQNEVSGYLDFSIL